MPSQPLLIRLAFGAYSVGVTLVVWTLLVPIELLGLALGRQRLADLRERLGINTLPTPRGSLRVLVHAVAMGETVAAAAFIRQLCQEMPNCHAILTSGNRDGRRMAERLRRGLPEIDACAFLPWDRVGTMRAWLSRLRPDVVVVVETEIWPNLFRACRELAIPLFIVSGRLNPPDVARYRLARPFFRAVLDGATWIGVQDDAARQAFMQIGAPPERTEVAGNLKRDASRLDGQTPSAWRVALDRPGLIVAGSTHAPEERLLLDALRSLRAEFPELRVVLAPLHIRRAGRLRKLAGRSGFRVACWSNPDAAQSSWDVLVLDEVGWLADVYRYAALVFIGGTVAPRGGHNPLEAMAHGTPIVVGPHFSNIRDTVIDLKEAGGIVCLEGGDVHRHLLVALRRLMADPRERADMGTQARRSYEARRAATRTYAAHVRTRLPDSRAAAAVLSSLE